jgi:hypothetical protein
VRRTDFTDASYCITRHVARDCLLADFTARWVAELKLDCHPSLVRLHLVPCPCNGEEEPTPAQEAAATVLPPRKTLAQAGVADGAWLLAVFATPQPASALEGESAAALLALAALQNACRLVPF